MNAPFKNFPTPRSSSRAANAGGAGSPPPVSPATYSNGTVNRPAHHSRKWTQKQIERISEMIRDGLTYKQIGEVLGISRNAVSGIVNRNPHLRISGAKPSPVSVKANRRQGGITGGVPGKTLREARKKARAKASVQPQEAVVVTVSADSAPDDISAPLMLSLMDLTNRTCRWPIGDPRASDFGFCGHETVSGSSYCSHHRERSIGQQTEREAA